MTNKEHIRGKMIGSTFKMLAMLLLVVNLSKLSEARPRFEEAIGLDRQLRSACVNQFSTCKTDSDCGCTTLKCMSNVCLKDGQVQPFYRRRLWRFTV